MNEYLVFGYCNWHDEDMALLKWIGSVQHMPVKSFDLHDLGSQAAIASAFPGVGPVISPPVVAYMKGGKVVKVASGRHARELAVSVLGLDDHKDNPLAR